MRHPLPIDRIAGLAQRGLTSAETVERRRRYGTNHIVEAVGHPAAELARETLRDPMIWFLVGTAVLYAVLGQLSEAITLAVSIAPLVVMDAFLHRRTQASLQGLRGLLADTARVVRDDGEATVLATEVVVGDLVVVATGEPFPADGVVVSGHELMADESALTGEAYPVAKRPLRPLPEADEALVDGGHWGFAGTRLLTGRATLRVVAVGGATVYGGIVRLAAGGVRARTPLQRAIGRLVTGLLVVAAVLCAVLAVVRLGQGHGWADAVVSAATLAVAALPEEFPVVLTVFLGVGVYRLARRRALVRRAVAVENIGRVSCICSDKTGTITEGRLRIARVVPAAGRDEPRAIAIAAAASRRETGDPLDLAVLERAGAGDVVGEPVAVFPFTEDRRRETAIVRRDDGLRACTKGAPEVVLAMCDVDERATWLARVAELAGEGHKVVACADRAVGGAEAEPTDGYAFAGLLAIADPVRAGVADAVRWCRGAGVRVLMVTGDHARTAAAIARSIGLAEAPVVVTGEALAAAPDVGAAIADADVVARALPAQKLSIVRALQAAGEVVAVTGDGVNDVPALEAADVGVAMGQRGARSAREVSAIVLLDDDFRSIVAAIDEGRALFGNLQRAFAYLLMIHAPLVLTATFVPLVGQPILYLPIHVVWLEALIHPTALLAFQRMGDGAGTLARPRGRDAHLFTMSRWLMIGAVGALVTALVTLAYWHGLAERALPQARALAMVALTLASASIASALSRLATRAARVIVLASVLIAIVLVQTPPIATLLALAPLDLLDWAVLLAGGAVVAAPIALAERAPPPPAP